jgi:hypothetical protein
LNLNGGWDDDDAAVTGDSVGCDVHGTSAWSGVSD